MSDTNPNRIIKRGTIQYLRGSWMSGLATLVLTGEDGNEEHVFCENAQTVRSLDGAFGNVIGEGHTINNESGGHVGKDIYYTTDFLGMLEMFIPADRITDEEIEAIRRELCEEFEGCEGCEECKECEEES